MTTLTTHDLGKDLDSIIEHVSNTSEPVFISGEHANAVLISEAEWSAIQETLHLMSVPGMSESLKEGRESPDSECSETLDW